ncbi:hypothetical protein ACIBJI_38985 [Nocardia sp. NPDC050408]|uniref:hypothetical protein n=1 Tax=unclassified Nocardia TaxID=2637762 RepID=UPI0034336CE2
MSFLGLDLKDIVVTAVSVVPGVGAPLAGLTDGIWTGVEEGSFSKGLQAGATTWAMSSIPGGKLAGGLLAKVGGPIAEKLATKGGIGKGIDYLAKNKQDIFKWTKIPGLKNRTAFGRGAKAVGVAGSRATGRAAGAYVGSRLDEAGWWPGNGGGGPEKSVVIPARPAGADIHGNYYGAKDGKAIIGDYNSEGKSQQTWPVSA